MPLPCVIRNRLAQQREYIAMRDKSRTRPGVVVAGRSWRSAWPHRPPGSRWRCRRPARPPGAGTAGPVRRCRWTTRSRWRSSRTWASRSSGSSPQIQDQSIVQAKRPGRRSSPRRLEQQLDRSRSTASSPARSSKLTNGIVQRGLGVNQTLPWGGNYSVAGTTRAQSRTARSQSPNPAVQSNLSFSFTQPLLAQLQDRHGPPAAAI